MIDEFTRECLAIDVAGGIRSARVLDVLGRVIDVLGRLIDVLGRLIGGRGAPMFLRSDNPSSSSFRRTIPA